MRKARAEKLADAGAPSHGMVERIRHAATHSRCPSRTVAPRRIRDPPRPSAPRRWTYGAATPREERDVLPQPADADRRRLRGARPRRFRAGLQSASTGRRANLPVRADGQDSFFLCLPELRGGHPALAGQMRILRRVEHDHRGSRRARRRRRGGAARSGGPAVPARGSVRRVQARAASRHRDRRARPGGRRRVRARIGDADRRRAGHRQVDAPDPGLRRGRALGRAGRLRLGRGIDRAGAAARRAARARRRPGAACGADPRRGHRRDARLRRRAEIRGHQFDPDHVERRDRIRRPGR